MKALIKHPISSNFIVCLLLFLTASICFNNIYLNEKEISFIIISTILSLINSKPQDKIFSFLLSLFCLLFYIAIFRFNYFLFISEILITLNLFLRNKNNTHNPTIFIIVLSFILHLFYIQQTDINTRQHDLNGIVLYINMISDNIKDFNPWYMYYLFHQPLHFFISGLILNFEEFLSAPYRLALETLQYLSLFYVTSSTIFFAYILRELKIKRLTFYSLLILFAFNPTLTLFSGYISDDVPVFFWSVFVIYYVIRWYNKNKLSYLCVAALGLGLGTLTKLSILMIVPAISFLFLAKLLSGKNKQLCIFHICLFIIISVPISLLWIARNHILFDMQFFNIPDTSPSGQNFSDYNLYDRLFDFSNLFTMFISAPSIVDHNILLSLIKTELFGEWDFSKINHLVYIPSALLYFIDIIIKALVFIIAGFIVYISLAKNKYNILYLFFAIIYITVYAYSIKYSMDFPYVCSSDFRLFASVNIAEIILLGFLTYNKKTNNALFISAVCYAFLSLSIYTMILL